MMSAEGDQVVEAGLAAVRPMMDVMSIGPGLLVAVGEPAAAIADVERRAQGLRDGPASSADVEDGTVVVFHDRWDHGITGQPAGGLRGQEAVPIEITAGAVFNLVIPVGFIGVDVQDQFATARPVQSACAAI